MYKHCDPCTHIGICPVCEEETCQTCGEDYDSNHLHLTDESHDQMVLDTQNNDLMLGRTCNRCTFYAYHDPNIPEQEEYDENLIYEVVEKRIRNTNRAFGGSTFKFIHFLKIVGIKPRPEFPIIRGPFTLVPTHDTYKDSLETWESLQKGKTHDQH